MQNPNTGNATPPATNGTVDNSKFDFINQVWDKATQLAKLPKAAQAIPVPKFCQAYLSCLSIPFTDVDLACLVVIFSDHGEQEEQLPLVTKRQFDLFLLRFGPPNKSLQKINNVLVNGKVWFHGNQGREASERLLREKPKEGLFLLRYSSVPGAFTVDYIKKQKICRFNNIRNDPSGGVEVVVGRQPNQQAYKYSTMDTFITKNAHIFQRPALNARSHFQWLKLRIPSAGSVRGGVGTGNSGTVGTISPVEAASTSSSSDQEGPSIPSNLSPEERVAQAIQHSYKTDKTVLLLKGFGIGPQLPMQVCVLKFLIQLDLSKNKLTSIPQRLSALRDLEQLTLSNNSITELPIGLFGNFNHLTSFHCSENQLGDLPMDFWQCASLTFVDLSVNKIKKISTEIKNLENLQFLDLSNNEIEGMLPSLEDLQNLEELLVGGNKIKEIPGHWLHLPNLIALDVSNNGIDKIPEEIYMKIKNEPNFSLDITGNRISQTEITKIKNLKAQVASAAVGANSNLPNSSRRTPGSTGNSSGTGDGSKDILELIQPAMSQVGGVKDPGAHLAVEQDIPHQSNHNGKSLWLTPPGYRLEEVEVGKKTLEPSDLMIREYSNKNDYKRYFYQKTAHANIIGDEKQLGPVCVSIQKEVIMVSDDTAAATGPNITSTSTTAGSMAIQMPGIGGGVRSFYRVLIRSKAGDQSLELPSNWVKLRKKERYARSEDLLSALRKMLILFSTKNLYVIRDVKSHHVFAGLESKLISNSSKFGVLYAKEGQDETAMYNNCTTTPGFEEFLDLLSVKIQMLGWKNYRGDLSNKSEQISRYTKLGDSHEIMLHVATYLKYQEVTDEAKQQWERKRFLGNDIVLVIYYEGVKPLDPATFVSNFNHVFALIQPISVGGKITSYRLHMAYKYGVNDSHPKLPEDPVFPKDQFKEFFLTKLVNSERCAMSAPQFRRAQEKVRSELFADLQKQFPKSHNLRRRTTDSHDNPYYITTALQVKELDSVLAGKKAGGS